MTQLGKYSISDANYHTYLDVLGTGIVEVADDGANSKDWLVFLCAFWPLLVRWTENHDQSLFCAKKLVSVDHSVHNVTYLIL